MKVVILDEADYITPEAQAALRNLIESFSSSCRFILTCNFKNRIIEPLHSRCGVYEFNTTKKDLAELAAQFYKRMSFVLDKEGISYDNKNVADLIMKHAPDWRRVINESQRRSISDFNSVGSSVGSIDSTINQLVEHLKTKNFKKMRSWVVNHMDVDTNAIFRGLYDNMNEYVDSGSIPQLVLILADYQYKDAFVADHELNIVACMTEIMANVEFN